MELLPVEQQFFIFYILVILVFWLFHVINYGKFFLNKYKENKKGTQALLTLILIISIFWVFVVTYYIVSCMLNIFIFSENNHFYTKEDKDANVKVYTKFIDKFKVNK